MRSFSNRFTVVLDACVLYPAPLRDLMMWMAVDDLFRAKWTDDIHNEWIAALLKNRPDLKREQLERTRKLMDSHVRDCLVIGYEPLIPELVLPDQKDRHILAAAIVCSADAIVTFNTRDFPERNIGQFGIETIHPDDFVVGLLEQSGQAVLRAAKQQRAMLRKPPLSVDEFLQSLETAGLVQTAGELLRFRNFL